MESQIKFLTLLLWLLFRSAVVPAQENFATNMARSSDEEKLVITYDIIPAGSAKSFSVVLFITHNGTKVNTTSVYGDIGVNIAAGREKAIVWYYKSDFTGDINTVQVDVFAYQENEPQAIFKISGQSNQGYAPCEVTFLNSSVYANEYEWNFGDPASGSANLSFEQHPKHLYKQGGVYSIALTARNTQLRLENVFYQSIEIKKHDPVTADFQVSGDHRLPPATVSFINKSVNADRFQWNFGDPGAGKKNGSNKKDAKYKYKNPGKFQVTLISENNFSGLSDTLVREVVIEQKEMARAGFVFTMSSETAPSTVAFKNTSVGGDKYEWSFGDAASGNKNRSTEPNPSHRFESGGSYSVELRVWGKGEKKPATYSETITIKDLPKPPEARFVVENNRVIGPATILFSNQSVNATTYRWDFGDPGSGDQNISSRTNPSHTYTKSGRYQVQLTASSPGFTRESTAVEWVEILSSDAAVDPSTPKAPSTDNGRAQEPAVPVTSPVPAKTEPPAVSAPVVRTEPPIARFESDIKTDLVPATIAFKNLSVNADYYRWNFGDFDSDSNESASKDATHHYQMPGRYAVKLVAGNTQSGKEHETSIEIVLKSPYKTFVKSDGFEMKSGIVRSLVPLQEKGFIALMTGSENSSLLCVVDPNGKILAQKQFASVLSDIVVAGAPNSFIMTGIELPDKLILQKVTADLNVEPPMIFPERKNFRSDYAFPKVRLGETGDFGVVANTLDDRYPRDILFQKADRAGKYITLPARTFKYVGNKMITDIVTTSDGGFAVTGYWQESAGSLFRILFSTIDRNGTGEIHLVSSDMNILGCDIENSYQGGYAVLRGEEIRENSQMYEISFTLLDAKGAPTECANLLPCSVKSDDMLKYKPSMIRIDDGYLVASHGYNGVDYDIFLFWIDKTGDILVRSERIALPGDQYVMDLKRVRGEGYMIAGTQLINGVSRPLMIKTDPWGKVNP